MWGNAGYNTYGLHPNESYAEAQHTYNNTKPIRGSANVRPLGKRKYGHQAGITAAKSSDQNPDYYAAKLYNTEVIKWLRPDDGIERMEISTGGWPTPTTAMFLNCATPYNMRAGLSRHVIRIDGWPIPRGGALKLEKRDGQWQATNAELESVHKINRTKANEVRRRFKDFKNWLHGMLALRENMFDDEKVMVKNLRTAASILEYMTAHDDDPAKYFKYTEALMWTVQNHGSTKGVGSYSGGTHRYVKFLTERQFDLMLMKLHAEEILVEEKLPRGTVKRDQYAGWL